MNRNHLAIFYAVAEEGSISRGADRLFISQPAVSKQLSDLERSLGQRLLDRTARGVRLTEAGQLLFGYAQRQAALEKEAEQALSELKGLERGRLAIGASTTIGGYLLPGILTAFRRRHPMIELHLDIANTDEIQRRVAEGRLDTGLTEGSVDATELEAEVFFEDELVVIAAPESPLLDEMPVSLERLSREPFVMREKGSGTRSVAERAFRERGVAVNEILTLGSTEAIKRAVIAGAGVSIASRLTIGLEREAGRLAVVEMADLSLRRPLRRLHLKGKHQSLALQAFHERMRRSLNSRSWKSYQML